MNALIVQENFGNVPSKIEFISNFGWDTSGKFTHVPDVTLKSYIGKEFDFINELYKLSVVGGSGGKKEPITFGIGLIKNDHIDSSKLDYSKKLIKDYLINNFDLTGKDLNIKINYLYKHLTSNRGDLNKEIDFDNKGDVIINNVPALKGYKITPLTNKGIVIKQINFICWLHSSYKLSNINMNDLRQDLILYYLTNQSNLLKHYRMAVKRYQFKYSVNYRFSFSTFIFKVLKKEFRKKVNSYLYAVNIPYEIEKHFVKKTISIQKKSKAYKDKIVITELITEKSQPIIKKVNSYIDKTKSNCKYYQKENYHKPFDQKIEVKKTVQEKIKTMRALPSIPMIKYTLKNDKAYYANTCFTVKRATAYIIGSKLYFDITNKYEVNQLNSLPFECLTKKDSVLLIGIDKEIFDLRVDGYHQKEIASFLNLTIDKVKKASQRINHLLNQ